MSIASYRRKLDRLDEDDEAEDEATLADLLQGVGQKQEQKRGVALLVDVARKLAGTHAASSAKKPPEADSPAPVAAELARYEQQKRLLPPPLPRADAWWDPVAKRVVTASGRLPSSGEVQKLTPP